MVVCFSPRGKEIIHMYFAAWMTFPWNLTNLQARREQI